MSKVKNALTTAGASVVLALSMVGAASANTSATNNCGDASRGGDLNCTAVSVDASDNRSYGPCTAFVNSDQKNVNDTEQKAENSAGGVVAGGNTASSNQSNSSNQGNSVSVNQDCSTSNVTNVHQAAEGGRGAGPQVHAPVGAVKAGAGGAAASSATAVAGLSGSLGLMGLGLRLRKGALGL